MKLVVIESPYSGDVETHIEYARRAMSHSLSLKEAPYASHLLLTQPGVLDDTVPSERNQGMEAGLAWCKHAHLTAVYTDYGISPGMEYGIARAKTEGRPVEMREIGKNPTTKHKYSQSQIDRMANYMMNGEEIEFPEDCSRIIKVLKTYRDIIVSVPMAFKFWRTRSDWWDACWLTIASGTKGDQEILEYWDKFVDDWQGQDKNED